MDDLLWLVGIHHASVSGNNRFLTEVGLISGGKVKTATPLGKTLGRALALSQTEDAILAWKEAVQSHEKACRAGHDGETQRRMSSTDLARHILYVSGQKDTKQNRTGARTIIDILLAAKLLEEKDGRLVVSSASEASAPKARNLEGELEFGKKRDMERVDTVQYLSTSSAGHKPHDC